MSERADIADEDFDEDVKKMVGEPLLIESVSESNETRPKKKKKGKKKKGKKKEETLGQEDLTEEPANYPTRSSFIGSEN